MVDAGDSGASSCTQPPSVVGPTDIIASRTPCSVLFLDVDAGHPEHPGVELDGLVEVGHRDPDVVDAEQSHIPCD